MKTTLVISAGQYEGATCSVVVDHKTERGLLRRARQLSREHATYGDNWAGWIPAQIAVASQGDEYFPNQIIGGESCAPATGWMDLD